MKKFCKQCNQKIKHYGKYFCSVECYRRYYSINNLRKIRLPIRCLYCKKYFEVVPSATKVRKFCSHKCAGRYNFFGKKHSPEHNQKISKSNIGKPYTIEHRENNSKAHLGQIAWNKGLTKKDSRVAKYANTLSKSRRGKSRPHMLGNKHWNWKGGVSKEHYPVGWRNLPIKEQVLLRDNYKCKICGCLHGIDEEKLVIHHIDYNKYNLEISNLLSLCRSCHAKTNFNREYWKKNLLLSWGTQILLLGGTGSWGQQLTKTLLTDPKISSITIFSRNEFNQVQMQRNFNESRLKFVVGDIRDYEAVYNACFNKNKVYLLSALKHVPVCEEQPEEAIKTNIIGTQNVIKASIEQNVETVVDVSSDKAVSPNTTYGMTKAIGEKLILNANKLGDTSFICIRAGNVLGSAGSVCPLFINQIKNTNTMTVTDGTMTRYFMSLPEAINLLLTAVNAPRGSLLVMKMPSCTIRELAETMKEVFGNETTFIKEIGARASEKKHELLVNSDESPICYVYNKDYYIISNDKLDLPKVNFEYYSSNSQPLMNRVQIKEMLQKGGFIK